MDSQCLIPVATKDVSAPQPTDAGGAGRFGGASAVQFAATIFLSAFLLFQVQPLIAKFILPWFGGGPAVWTACMLFFQSVLLLGYAYAHAISTWAPRHLRGWIHLGLLTASLFALPITPEADVWKPSPGDLPTLHILLLLLVNVGMPYMLLSSTGPLLQHWFSAMHPGRSPYRLYALSNTGSLLALLTYPVIFEPAMTLGLQASVWSWVYGAFVVLCGATVFGAVIRPALGVSAASEETGVTSQLERLSRGGKEEIASPPLSTVSLWLLLAASASAMLLATTNQMCQEVAVVPFLWIVPLALYLGSFIICFDHERWYNRRWFGALLALLSVAACAVLYGGVYVDILVQVAIYSLVLFACCMTCHGELVRSKPHPRHLTLFYLTVAMGGALGGLFVAVAAPRLFTGGYWEFHVALVSCIVLTLVAWYRNRAWVTYLREPVWTWGGAAALVLLFSAALGAHAYVISEHALLTTRNFYGVLRLTDVDEYGAKRALSHGRVVHGVQFLEPEKRSWPTSYYGPESGVGLAIQRHPRRLAGGGNLRIGVVGLGAGTIAAFGQPGDYLRFYEINPDVIDFSREYFSFVSDSRAQAEMVLGDARVEMERELARREPQQFDVLAIDAFSSDAIPVHLITSEVVELYLRHLRADGLLLFHITNRSIDLDPVVRGLAQRHGLRTLRIQSDEDKEKGVSLTVWGILTNNQDFLRDDAVLAAATPWPAEGRAPILWSDNFASLWQILKH